MVWAFDRLVLGAVMLIMAALPVRAEPEFAVYGGFGQSREDAGLTINEVPFSFGALAYPFGSDLVLGVEVAREGERMNAASNQMEQAYAVNAIIGARVYHSADISTDFAAILGFREDTAPCADGSGLGCYTGSEPRRRYVPSLGGLVAVSVQRMVFGLRLSEQSSQGLIGIRF